MQPLIQSEMTPWETHRAGPYGICPNLRQIVLKSHHFNVKTGWLDYL